MRTWRTPECVFSFLDNDLFDCCGDAPCYIIPQARRLCRRLLCASRAHRSPRQIFRFSCPRLRSEACELSRNRVNAQRMLTGCQRFGEGWPDVQPGRVAPCHATSIGEWPRCNRARPNGLQRRLAPTKKHNGPDHTHPQRHRGARRNTARALRWPGSGMCVAASRRSSGCSPFGVGRPDARTPTDFSTP